MTPTPTDWAYLAGMIDADGSISCYPIGTRGTRRTIAVSNTSAVLAEWLKSMFGPVSISWQQTNVTPLAHGRVPIFMATWNSKANILRIGKGIEPYLVIKGDRLDKLLVNIANAPGPGAKGFRRVMTCKWGHDCSGVPAGKTCPMCIKRYNDEAYARRKAKA